MPVCAYYRWSTDKQSDGTSLEYQRHAVKAWAESAGEPILAEFMDEGISGADDSRAGFAQAVQFVRKHKGCRIAVSHLSRASRSVRFIAQLVEDRIPLLDVSNPAATDFVTHIMASVSAFERSALSDRTKRGMAVLKAKGIRFGMARTDWSEEGKEAARSKGRAIAARNRLERSAGLYELVRPLVSSLRAEGQTLGEIAERLNRQGIKTPMGREWNPVQVHRLVNREITKSSETFR